MLGKSLHSLIDIFEVPNPKEIGFGDEDRKYMKSLIQKSPTQLSQEDAEEIMKVTYHYHDYGKEEALREFGSVAKKIIERESQSFNAIMKISYLSGVLYPNGVLTKEESDDFGKKWYCQIKLVVPLLLCKPL